MKKISRIAMILPVLVSILSACQTKGTVNEWDTINLNRVSIHDPSITSVVKNGEEIFYRKRGKKLSIRPSADAATAFIFSFPLDLVHRTDWRRRNASALNPTIRKPCRRAGNLPGEA